MNQEQLNNFLEDLERRENNRAALRNKPQDKGSYTPVRTSWKKYKLDLIIK